MCYTWAGYDEMGAKCYLSCRGKKTGNDFKITLLMYTFLNPLIEMVFQDHLKSKMDGACSGYTLKLFDTRQ